MSLTVLVRSSNLYSNIDESPHVVRHFEKLALVQKDELISRSPLVVSILSKITFYFDGPSRMLKSACKCGRNIVLACRCPATGNKVNIHRPSAFAAGRSEKLGRPLKQKMC